MRINTLNAAAIVVCLLSAWNAYAALILNPDGLTVYDTVNNVNWLADVNLAATNRFGLPICTGSGALPCVNASGSMNYQSAAAWVNALNSANYLGHTNWQLPATPPIDQGCGKTGPNGDSFGFGCTASALGSLYYNALGLKAPNTAVPIPSKRVGPFSNFQPYLYWSQSSLGSSGYATFSFGNGFHGANTTHNFLYVLPMIQGKMPGTPAASGNTLQINPGGQTVYDPVASVTWLANANLAASNTFGLPVCQSPTSPTLCVAQDGAMTWDSAGQFVHNMNSAAYLGQTNWQLPPIDASCSGYNCTSGSASPMGELFYGQLGLSKGTPVVAAPNVAVGPFHNIQPYLYWTCAAVAIQSACEASGPIANQEWSFTFGSGFEGTDVLTNDLYATAYYAGPPPSGTAPQINSGGIVIHAGTSAIVSPGSLADIYGTNLAAAALNAPAAASLTVSLGGVQVLVDGTAAPLIYVGPIQIIFQVPYETPIGTASVVVVSNSVPSVPAPVTVQPAAPFILTYGSNRAVVVNQDHSVNASGNGDKPGDVLVAYLIGSGPLDNPIATGALAPSSPLSRETLPTTVTVGAATADVKFDGMAPGFAGLVQVNFVMPNLAPGDYQLQITIGSASSNQPVVTVSR